MRSDQEPNHRKAAVGRTRRNASVSVELLEGRALLSGPGYPGYGPPPSPPPITRPAEPPIPRPTSPAPIPIPAKPIPITGPTEPPISHSAPKASGGTAGHHPHGPSGIVTKAPRFYQFYTGPKWAELNAVKASAELSPDGTTFTFTGTNQGRIDKAPAFYVWGVDRNGNLPIGPFTSRPNIKFDALVIVSLNASLTPTAHVLDLATATTTNLPADSASVHGHAVSVTVASSLLPSTGLAPSHYRFNFWSEDGGPPVSAAVASFAPELNTAQVGIAK